MAPDVGTIGMTQDEADRLREHLEKGAFLWVDDFWGERLKPVGARTEKAMPLDIYPIQDILLDDPVFKSMLEGRGAAQVPQHPFLAENGG